MNYLADIGLEVHAELQTNSKMFCGCAQVDTTAAKPNTAVCPVCLGLPGALPVVNHRAVEYGMRVALALGCTINPVSIFARKNYFYPDLPKGYQISQYESPLAEHGELGIYTSAGEKSIRIRRVHLEEDTGKLTHVNEGDQSCTLVDLNRAGVPLLEIVSEPDMHSAEDAAAYGRELRTILRALGVNSGDMEKGVLRFEANISVRPEGSQELGTKVEVKNLNSFKAMEKAIEFEIKRQIAKLEGGELVLQETMGWEDISGVTFSQRSKEEAHDYRYFPEPDLPPLVIDPEWMKQVQADLPELPKEKARRFVKEYRLKKADAQLLVEDGELADYFERTVCAMVEGEPRLAANWITGELFGWMKLSGESLTDLKVNPENLGELLDYIADGSVNTPSAKVVLTEMLQSGSGAKAVIEAKGLKQVSDGDLIARLVADTLKANPAELQAYHAGKVTLENWFFGQVMKAAGGKANPQVVREELRKQLGT